VTSKQFPLAAGYSFEGGNNGEVPACEFWPVTTPSCTASCRPRSKSSAHFWPVAWAATRLLLSALFVCLCLPVVSHKKPAVGVRKFNDEL
jgi:hypothetical protein